MSVSERTRTSFPRQAWDNAPQQVWGNVPRQARDEAPQQVRDEALHILYMEDDPGLARLVQKQLGRANHVVHIAQDGGQGLAMCASGDYDLLLIDQNMPVHDGLEVIRSLAAQDALPPTIMITGAGSEIVAVEALKLGARDYLVKDVESGYLELLPAVIAQVLAQERLLEEKQRAEAQRDATLEALREYASELEARNQELDAFAQTVAHDLKGPLSTGMGICSLLQENWSELSTDEIERLLEMNMRVTHKMHNIINELLLLASVRKEEVEVSPIDMGSIVLEVQVRLADMIAEHQAEIIQPDAWPQAQGYGPWIEEVWTNYLSNAIQYGGRPPHVELGVTSQADAMLRFWVHDNGAGLTADEQSRLFSPFTRLDQTRAKGHGLGLSIVRRIVEKLGGQVGVDSLVGQGSVFSFTLPASPSPQEGLRE
jgi:two-component system sensor histidine kinase/response regulator